MRMQRFRRAVVAAAGLVAGVVVITGLMGAFAARTDPAARTVVWPPAAARAVAINSAVAQTIVINSVVAVGASPDRRDQLHRPRANQAEWLRTRLRRGKQAAWQLLDRAALAQVGPRAGFRLRCRGRTSRDLCGKHPSGGHALAASPLARP
jgi:hypothetical protein